jgi:DNA helicase-2/ATP-dependent DNA helicase PcrA
VKDVLSFIRAALNPESLSDIKRIVNAPPRGIGKVTLIKMFSGKENKMTPAVKKRVEEFRNLLKRIKDVALTKKVSQTIKFVIKESGLEKKLKEGTEEDLERLENIKELVSLGAKYDEFESEEGIIKLLEEASLATEQDSLDQKTKKNKDGVKLMTMHASKGLEFEYVFITGLEEGLFPHDVVEEDEDRDSEEERRLFYVALTRAKKQVFLTCAGERIIYGTRVINLPSIFLTELDEDVLEEIPFQEEDVIKLE